MVPEPSHQPPEKRKGLRGLLRWLLALTAAAISGGLLYWRRRQRQTQRFVPVEPPHVHQPPPRTALQPVLTERVVYLEPEELRRPDGRIEHPTVRRETKDVTLRLVLGVLTAGGIVGGIAAFWIWQVVVPEQKPPVGERSLYAPPPLTSQLPPPPRLDPLMTEEPEAREPIPYGFEAAQRLHRYGPTDAPGYVHIPIEKAIELTAGNLPADDSPLDETIRDQGLVGGGESNSGRLYQDLPSWLKTAVDPERPETESQTLTRVRQE